MAVGEEDVAGVQGPDLNVRAAVGSSFRSPFGENCARFASTCKALYDSRATLYSKLGHFLFGAETDLDRWSADFGSAVRSSMVSAGIGDWADTLMGSAPKRPGVHAKLLLERLSCREVNIKLRHFHDVDEGTSGPELVPGERLLSYDDIWLSSQHLTVDVDGGEAYSGASVSCSDMTLTGGIGAHPEAVEQVIDQAWRFTRVLGWLASSDGHPSKLKVAYLMAFPYTSAILRRFVDMQGAHYSKRQLDSKTVEVCLEMPFDIAEAASHYPRTADLLSLLDPLEVTLRRAGDKATLFALSYKETVLKCRAFFREGRLAWMEPEAGFVEWGADGRISLDATIDVTVIPLGITAAAIELPRRIMRAEVERRGKVVVTCVDTGEPAAPLAASAVLDHVLLRRLLHEAFKFEVDHVREAGTGRSSFNIFGHLVFPSSTVSKLISQWFYGFALRQICELDVMQAASDLMVALAQDAAVLGSDDDDASPL